MVIDYYRPQRSCEGYVFTPVCHSVHRGGLPQCMLGYYPSPQTRHPPPTRQPCPGPGTPREQTPPRTRHPPRETATVADGTHPTGMHSCFKMWLLNKFFVSPPFLSRHRPHLRYSSVLTQCAVRRPPVRSVWVVVELV